MPIITPELTQGANIVARIGGDYVAGTLAIVPSMRPTLDTTTGTYYGPGTGAIDVDGERHSVNVADLIPHVEYPHHPGALYDCSACEYVCHCSDGSCVACALDVSYPGEADTLELEHDAYEASGMAGAYFELDSDLY